MRARKTYQDRQAADREVKSGGGVTRPPRDLHIARREKARDDFLRDKAAKHRDRSSEASCGASVAPMTSRPPAFGQR